MSALRPNVVKELAQGQIVEMPGFKTSSSVSRSHHSGMNPEEKQWLTAAHPSVGPWSLLFSIHLLPLSLLGMATCSFLGEGVLSDERITSFDCSSGKITLRTQIALGEISYFPQSLFQTKTQINHRMVPDISESDEFHCNKSIDSELLLFITLSLTTSRTSPWLTQMPINKTLTC